MSRRALVRRVWSQGLWLLQSFGSWGLRICHANRVLQDGAAPFKASVQLDSSSFAISDLKLAEGFSNMGVGGSFSYLSFSQFCTKA